MLTDQPDNAMLRETLAQSFEVHGELIRLPGGEGRTYRAGNTVYRRDGNLEELTFIAELYHSIRQDGFRVPLPQRSKTGSWATAGGWTAWTFLDGRAATADDLPSVIPAIQAFHRALANVPPPGYLAQRDSPYVRADRLAWADAPLDMDDRFASVLRPLLERRQPVPDLRSQLIHGDLNETNILVTPGAAPAMLDMTPYWRPPEFALAVLAYWLGPYRGDSSILPAFAHIPAFDQMLIRVGLRTMFITQEFGRHGAEIGDVEQEYRMPGEIICRWVDR